MENKFYSPLPDCLTISISNIHGLGLYATKKIEAGVTLGISHVKDDRFENGYIRTPLGGFFNHSKNPNCVVVYEGDFIYLKTLRELFSGEEITVTYTFYDPEKSNHPQCLEATHFIEIIKKECERAGVTYLFPETEKVAYPGIENTMVSGYFDDKIPMLACAIGKPENEWYEILVHESCHMDQWEENGLNQYKDGIDCDKVMDEWIGGRNYTTYDYTCAVRVMQALEIDCEKRAVRKILNLGLGIDIKKYTKKANAYLFFYSVILHTRKWCDIAPYNVPEIIDVMPDYFLEEEGYINLEPQIIDLYKTKCYK